MDEILYQEVSISEGLLKSRRVQITLYTDRLEIAYSKAMSLKEIKKTPDCILYIEKEIIYYNKVRDYSRIERVLGGISGYQNFLIGDFEAEKAGKRKKITTVAIQTMSRALWDAIDIHTPLRTNEKREAMEAEVIEKSLADTSVAKGSVEIEVGARMIKTMRLFINDIEWKQYTYPPVCVQLPLGTYQIKIARGVPNANMMTASDTFMEYAYTNEVIITLSREKPVIRLAAEEGFFSPSLKIVSE